MAGSRKTVAQMAEETAGQLTSGRESWTRYLESTSRLYKYPFREQLMIYAQNPKATACADIDTWNGALGRWIRRGAKGIALIDNSGAKTGLRHVFDIADTVPGRKAGYPYIWEMRDEFTAPVIEGLAKNYDDTGGTLPETVHRIAGRLAREYWDNHGRDVLAVAPGSLLEELDSKSAEMSFRGAVTVSAAHSIMARCGLDAGEYFDAEDYRFVFDFNTPKTVYALGAGISEISSRLLRDIEKTVKNHVRKRAAERTYENAGIDVQRERGLSASESDSTGVPGGNDARQVRHDEEGLSAGTQAGAVQYAAADGNPAHTPVGDRPDGAQPPESADGTTRGVEPATGQGGESDGLGGAHEQSAPTRGGIDTDGIGIRLSGESDNRAEAENNDAQESPSVGYSQFGESSMEKLISTSPVTLAEVDSVLRDGGNDNNSVLRIAARYAKDKSPEERADFLRREYLTGRYGRSERSSGKGFDFGNHRVCAWYDVDGISLAIGTAAKNNMHRVTIPWNVAAARVSELFGAGQYVVSDTLADALDNERSELADRLLDFYRDDMHSVPEEWKSERGGHPDDVAIIKSLLDDGDGRRAVLDRLEADVDEWANTEHERVRHNPNRLLADMRDAMLPPVIFPNAEIQSKPFKYFITQDEIDALLAHGGTYSEGKFRFLSFFLGDHDEKEKLDFVKREYGHGGGTWSQTDGWQHAEPGKGLSIKRGNLGSPDAEVNLKWPAVIKRTEQLIQSGQYMTRAELDRIPNYERLMLMRQLQAFFRELPEGYERPFDGLDFHYPREAEWEALRDLLDDPKRVDTLLAVMEPIYLNTIEEDRYYNTRKAAWDNLNAYRDGEYTLFPGLENLPEPGTVTARRFDAPRRETIANPGEPLFGEASFGESPQIAEQMTLFGTLPELPGVDEQRQRIDRSLREEARTERPRAEAEAVISVLENDIDDVLLNISNENKARLYEQFADSPRSREAVNLVREIYGGTLPFPLPQAIKRVTELVELGFLDGIGDPYDLFDNVRDELDRRGYAVSGELVEDGINGFRSRVGTGEFTDIADFIVREFLTEEPEFSTPIPKLYLTPVGDFYEIAGDEAQIAANVLGLTMTPRNGEPMVGFPNSVLDDYIGRLADAGYAVIVPEADLNPPQFAEITNAAEIAETEAIFGDGKPAQSHIAGQRIVLDLREKLGVAINPDVSFVAGEFVIDDISGDIVTVSATYQSDGKEARFSTFLTHDDILRCTVNPVADKLFEETSPSGRSTTAYYLFRYPDGVNAGAVLDHEALALIKDRADVYVVCAEACYLSESEMNRFNLGFRKMPRDWNMLPPDVRSAVREIKPEYETQWRDNTQWERDLDQWKRENGEQSQEPQAHIDARLKGVNFRITDDRLGEGGEKAKFRANIAALQTLKAIEFDGRTATPEEQETLSRYVGWGSLPQVFEENHAGWENEFVELYTLLSPEEYESARASTLNAHYTSPVVIRAIYDAVERMGFKTGNVLEPACGVGNFFGLLPESMNGAKLYGVEIDRITAGIAGQLYPGADIRQSGFENTEFPDAFFDLAIGNVPFGGYGVADSRYNKHKFNIHDYFFAKSLDKVRPGGIVAFITSSGTMDKQNPDVRKYIAQRAELLGAVRLPNNAFRKNAGTEVTSDIVFLQKRERAVDIEPDWVHLGYTDDGIRINSYFADNPDMVLGKMIFDEHGMYGRAEPTCSPIPGADLAEQLDVALTNIRGRYAEAELEDVDGIRDESIPADPDVKNYSYTVVDDRVYYRVNSRMNPVDLPATTLERIKGMVRLRDITHTLIDMQLDDYGDEDVLARQRELSAAYDDFVKEYGLVNSKANSRAFADDSSYYLLCALELIDEDGRLERKSDMFDKRTVRKRVVVTSVDTASEALAVSLGERACVDLGFMASLMGGSEKIPDIVRDLRGVIFKDPKSGSPEIDMDNPDWYRGWQTADEYLSGNVREKLAVAREYAMQYPEFAGNVSALEAVQPQDLEAGDIAVRLGTTWIDKKYVNQFMYDLLQVGERAQTLIKAEYCDRTADWNIAGIHYVSSGDVLVNVTYGTKRKNAYEIIRDTLNLKDVRVFDTITGLDGKDRSVLNKKETMIAQQKQEVINRAFKDWIWADPARREELVNLYNVRFNSYRPREYNGEHITLAGAAPDITLRTHQMNAIARILYGGNTLLAHEVGAGKTFEMVGAAMEAKRLGQCNKSLFAVPNHLTEQWATEFMRLYPNANILVAKSKDFEKKNRKKFCARIATGDYDAIIIGHSQFEKIPMSKEYQTAQINSQISEIAAAVRMLRGNSENNFTVKQMERLKRSLHARLAKLNDDTRKDDVITFEHLGVDRLFVDEAHNYKDLQCKGYFKWRYHYIERNRPVCRHFRLRQAA
jgi:N12 class adenine-specific DNA methylase